MINPRDHHQTDDHFQAKKEGRHDHDHDHDRFSKMIANTSTTSRQWSAFKNPRIVRVSRTFGGKDRHSKVCTVRGLRDRRIRLSVPTAVQLYDLQDRLGLSQPSKVVAWLMEATKHEIDKLPPLPNIPGLNFAAVNTEASCIQENQGFEGFMSGNHQISAQDLFPLSGSTSNFPYNLRWDPPSLSLSQFGPDGGYGSYSNDQGDQSHGSISLNPQVYLPSIVAPFSSSSSQVINSSIESNMDQLRRINQFQNLHQQNSMFPTTTTLHLIGSSSPMKAFGLDVNSKSVDGIGKLRGKE